MTADDGKDSLERFMTKSPLRARLEPVQSVDVADRHAVRIALKDPHVKGCKHHDGYDLGRRLTFTWIDTARP